MGKYFPVFFSRFYSPFSCQNFCCLSFPWVQFRREERGWWGGLGKGRERNCWKTQKKSFLMTITFSIQTPLLTYTLWEAHINQHLFRLNLDVRHTTPIHSCILSLLTPMPFLSLLILIHLFTYCHNKLTVTVTSKCDKIRFQLHQAFQIWQSFQRATARLN